MELPERYLKRLGGIYYVIDFDDPVKASELAIEIGDSLKMIGEDESKYIIDHSYDSLFCKIGKEVGISKIEWQEKMVEGMGDVHKDLKKEVVLRKKKTNKNSFER